ncbi:MAG TPA: DUF4838 domain-containing protein, partial [Lentisphaeria bacterium]|nr:DUF4838 domain-containing protein [Lentisphaeria bacterium]
MRTIRNTVYIVANEPKGVLNGVYDFLERNTDIVFHRPNAQPIYGHTPNLTAKHADYRQVPAFIQRGFQINVDQQYEPSELWLARNRNNTTAAPEQFRDNRLKYGMWQSYGGGHNLKRWIPPQVYGESNPDFFPMIDGKRDVNGHNQLCFTNPRLLDEMTRLVLEQISLAPSPTYYKTYNIMTEDCNGLCECPQCLAPIKLPDGALLPPDDPSFRSTQHYIFMNEVARRVTAIHPKVKINTYAYSWSVTPPKIELLPSVTARFCTVMKNDKESINGPSNAKWLDLTTRWSRQKANLVWREYYGLGARFCRPVAEVVAEDLRTILALGINRAFSESAFNENPDRQKEHHPFDVSAMEYWVISRLYWDPTQDVQKLRDDFLRRTFREAFAPMKTFFDAIRQKWYATAKASTFLDNPVKSADYYIIQAGIETLCRDSLVEAEALAVHPGSLKQVRAIRSVFEYWMAEAPKSRTPEIVVPKIKDVAALADMPWQINGLNRMNSAEPSQFQSRIRLAHDMDNLFIDFAFDHPAPDQINGVRPPQPKETWPAGEHLEFFLDGALADQAQYYFFVFNAFGLKWDGIGTESDWNGDWSLQTEIHATGWTAHLIIPMNTIGVNVTSAASSTERSTNKQITAKRKTVCESIPAGAALACTQPLASDNSSSNGEPKTNLAPAHAQFVDVKQGDSIVKRQRFSRHGLALRFCLILGLAMAVSMNALEVRNPSFEDGRRGKEEIGSSWWWNNINCNAITLDTEVKRSGQRSLCLDITENSILSRPQGRYWNRHLLVSQSITAEPETIYTVKAWIKTTLSKGTAGIAIQMRKKDGALIRNHWAPQKFFVVTAPMDDWQELVYTFKTPDECERFDLILGAEDALGKIWFDDVSAAEGASIPAVPNAMRRPVIDGQLSFPGEWDNALVL